MSVADDIGIMREHGFDYREKIYWLTDENKWISALLSGVYDDGEPIVKYYGGRYAWSEAITTWDRIKKFTDKSHLKRKPKPKTNPVVASDSTSGYTKVVNGAVVCTGCGKRVVHPDDYGDYDDACEWSCNCKLNDIRW